MRFLNLDREPDFDPKKKKNKHFPKNMRHYQKTFEENPVQIPKLNFMKL